MTLRELKKMVSNRDLAIKSVWVTTCGGGNYRLLGYGHKWAKVLHERKRIPISVITDVRM
jgi:hypothetical protein